MSGALKSVGSVVDSVLGTDFSGEKAAAEKAQAAALEAANEQELTEEQNEASAQANASLDDVASVQAGGSATESDDSGLSGSALRKRHAQTISSSLGL